MAVILNGEEFNFSDFQRLGHTKILEAGFGRPAERRWPDRVFSQMLAELETAAGNSTTAQESAAAAAQSESNAAQSETNAETAEIGAVAAKDLAIAAAASADFPFTTTAGTASAYTVNFTPDRIVGDGFTMRVNFHTSCNAAPTIAVDGGTAYEIVDGLSLTDAGAYRQLDSGDIRTGMNLIVTYDSTVNKMVITGGFPIYELSRDLNFNGYNAKNIRGYNSGASYPGALKDGAATKYYYFANATRLYNIKVKTSTGTINVVLSKNGSTDINFGAGPSTTVGVTSTLTAKAVNHSSNAYIDFAQGDFIKFTFSSNSAAADFLCLLDAQGNYA